MATVPQRSALILKYKDVPCDGEAPLVNPVTGREYTCGEDEPHRYCPPSSYCHKTSTFAKCCREGSQKWAEVDKDNWTPLPLLSPKRTQKLISPQKKPTPETGLHRC
ncbi:hypothetical protein AVEN_214025-1 [Araneus ventricosus]|uniref:Uncharacterized protein n=1 Tax=Araneus ventricosus TaxID=182803 RepID=A0A4Y2VQ89_ARAVE|nr:hypothetical protein AVEN_214025-1 [Araneus ventricosus]